MRFYNLALTGAASLSLFASGTFSATARAASPCGSTGALPERIADCAESRSTSEGARVITVERSAADEAWSLDDSTGLIWSPVLSEAASWDEALQACAALAAMAEPPLGLRTWHLPAEQRIVGDKARSEFLTAFRNPRREQAGAPGFANFRNRLLFEAFPEMSARSWWSATREGYGAWIIRGADAQVTPAKLYPRFGVRCLAHY